MSFSFVVGCGKLIAFLAFFKLERQFFCLVIKIFQHDILNHYQMKIKVLTSLCRQENYLPNFTNNPPT